MECFKKVIFHISKAALQNLVIAVMLGRRELKELGKIHSAGMVHRGLHSEKIKLIEQKFYNLNGILGNLKNTQYSAVKTGLKWSFEETNALSEAHKLHGSNWKLISQNHFPSRTPCAIQSKITDLKSNRAIIDHKYTLNRKKWTPKEDRKKWTPEEDRTLKLAAEKHSINGKIQWKVILSTGCFPERSIKSLHNRYKNHLADSKKDSCLTEEELILRLEQKLGIISQILQKPPFYMHDYHINYVNLSSKKFETLNEVVVKFSEFFEIISRTKHNNNGLP
ncbi:hypothetical protein G9A89_003945 [Geosiphon pyriformis]|nr:hypothetical protein G9A89_003945 [Geosiphon pyriformis]